MKRGTRRNRMFLAVFLSLCLAVTMLGGSVTVRAEEETQGTSLTDPAGDSVTERQEEEQTDESKEGQPSTQEDEDQSTVQEGESQPTAQEEEAPPVKQQEDTTDPESESGTNSAPAEEEDVSGNDIDLMMNSPSTKAIARGPQGMLVIKIGNTVQGAADPDETFSFHAELNIANFGPFPAEHPVVYYYAGSDYPSLSDLQPYENLDFSETFALKDGENYYLAACMTSEYGDELTLATVTIEETDSKGYNVSYQKYGGGKQDDSGDWGEPVGSETEGAAASHNWGTIISTQSICYGVGFINTMPGNQYSLMYDANDPEEEVTEMPQDESVTSQEDSYTFTIPSQEPYQGYWYKSGGTYTPPDRLYKFKGWATSPDGKAAYQPGDTVTVTKENPELRLYAIWEKQYGYKLYSKADGPGELINNRWILTYVTTEKEHTFVIPDQLPEMNKDHWGPNGWYYTDNEYICIGYSDTNTFVYPSDTSDRTKCYYHFNFYPGTADYRPGDSITLTADDPSKDIYVVMEESRGYTLTYDANAPAGEVSGLPDPQSAKGGQTEHVFRVSEKIPVRAGWKFEGWALEAAGTVCCQAGGRVTAKGDAPDMILYAVWSKEQGNPSGGQDPNPGGSNPGNPNPSGSNPTPGTSAPGTPANDSLLAQIAAAAQGVLGVRTDETARAGQEAASGQAQGVLGARTGDEAPIAAWAMAFALSALALAVLRRKRGAKTA